MRSCCPSCNSKSFIKNGVNHHGDQNHKCLECNRQFVLDPQNKVITEETKALVRRLLLERLSLKGICRAVQVSEAWLLGFIKREYAKAASDLEVQAPPEAKGLILKRIEADELWSFVRKKKNQVWIWLALDATTRQVVAVYAGGRAEKDAKAFWNEVPEPYRSGYEIYTDEWHAYEAVIPQGNHFPVKKSLGKPAL